MEDRERRAARLELPPTTVDVIRGRRESEHGGSRVRPIRLAYIMSRFPKLSETFVLYEALEVRRLGADVLFYPLIREASHVQHHEVAELDEHVHAARPVSWSVVHAALHFARRSPRRLLATYARVVFANLAPKRSFLATLATLPRATWMARQMQRQGIEHIHAHFATHATTAAYVVHRLTGIPYSFTAHAQDIYLNQRMLGTKVRAAAFVATISRFNRRFITRHAGAESADKIHVVHCGVDTDVFRPPDDPQGNGPLRIVCVGRLVEMKGQTHLVEACRILRERGVSVRCTLVGDGDCRAALERQVADSGLGGVVELLGGQSRDVVLHLVGHADVVVLPSVVTPSGRMEGIPVALMEALACERAVVATRISGIPELIEDGKNGLLVEPGDASALADALELLAHDDALRARLGAAGRRTVLAEFDLAQNARRLYELILQSLERRTA